MPPLNDELDLQDTMRTSWASVRRYKLMQLAIIALALLVAAAYLALRPGAFTATARVLVDNRVLAIAQQDAVYSTSVLSPQLVQSQVEILRSESLAQQVIDRLALMQTEEFVLAADLTEQQRRRQALDQFKRRLSVEVVPQSHVVEVRYTAREAQRAAAVANALIEAYLQDQTNANSAAAKSSSGWLRGNMRALGTTGRVLGAAMPPANRDGPAPPFVLAFALFCGIGAGVATALARGFLDGRMRTARDVQRAAGYLPLAAIPRTRSKGARPLLIRALQAPKSQFAHAMQRLTAALSGLGDEASRVTGVSALRAGGGATLVCANVARAAARAGKRVLLIDASRYSGTLTDLARDNDTLDEGLLVDTWSGLRFASIVSSPDPVRALASLLDRNRDAFDLVIVDLPALEPAADTMQMLPLLDRLVLVVAAGEDDAVQLREGIVAQPLVHEKLAGLVLNRAARPQETTQAPFYHDEKFLAEVPPLSFEPPDATQDALASPGPDGTPVPALRPLQQEAAIMRSGTAGAILALLFACSLMLLPAPARAEPYRLGTGDTLRVKVSEWPDLGGEYMVGAGGQLALPVIGNIEAGGLTIPELSATIGAALQKRGALQETPAAAVAIVSYRPFFILGDVQKPGEYAYRPGLTVLQAISVAGGYYRPLDTAFRLERDAISARSDIGREQMAVKRAAARIMRLEAERADTDDVAAPSGFDTTPGSADHTLLEEERATLRANKDALAKLLASLDHYKDLYEQEIKTVTEQIATERQQASSVQRELDSLKGLLERGLSPLTRQLATERTLAQILGTIQGLQATILRARQNIGLTEQRRIDAINARTLRINEGLQTARAEERDALQRLRAARALLEEAEVIAPGLQASAQLTGVTPQFTILRDTGNGRQDIAAERTSDVRPGDVLTVERRLAQQAGGSAPGTRSTASRERGR